MSPSLGLADPAQLAASDPLSAPDLLSPEGIHEYLLRAHTISNEIHFKFLQALRALDEGGLFHALGFPTIRAYTEEFFGWDEFLAPISGGEPRLLWTPAGSSPRLQGASPHLRGSPGRPGSR
jgi:hypothetical protein